MGKKEVKRLPYDRKKTEAVLLEATKKLPETAQPYAKAAVPVLAIAGEVMSKIEPVVALVSVKLGHLWTIIEPYHPEDLMPAILGLLMCFFGGTFTLTIAAVEAWRATSWEQNKRDFKALYADYKVVAAAHAKDNSEDKDGDGIADVDQIDATTLFWRKVGLAMKSVDPDRFTAALGSLYAGALAVVCALQLQFARTIALGAGMGEILGRPACRYGLPTAEAVLPAQYKKWARPIITMLVKLVAIQIAWFLQRIVSAVHCALRGGTMFARGILAYLSKKGMLPDVKEQDTFLDEMIGGIVALIGFWFQFRGGWRLPFPVNVLLLPLTILEGFLAYFVSK